MDTRAIFLGDSITASTLWDIPQEERNCGIAGQTAQQIAVRAQTEIPVGDPKYVHILAGTNGLTSDPTAAVSAIDSMMALAQGRGLISIVGTIPPWNPMLWPTESTYVVTFNTVLAAAVAARGAILADYYTALLLNGTQNVGCFQSDGLHPNANGYLAMNSVLAPLMPNLKVRSYRTANYDITPGMALGEAHYLYATPWMVQVFLICKNAEHGYSAGMVVPVNPGMSEAGGASNRGVAIFANNSVIGCRLGADADPIGILDIGTGVITAITPSNWQIFLRAFV